MLDLLFQNPMLFLALAAVLVISLTIHEFSHAYTADKLGDPTARYLGRVTLNPIAHLDPLGSLMIVVAGFGWGRPVPFNPINLANPKRDAAIISFAGPASNLLLAVLVSLIIKSGVLPPLLTEFFLLVVVFNLMLAFFNLLPIHPLDGFKVVSGLLPRNLSAQWEQMESYGLIILIILIATSSIGKIISPLVDFSLILLGFQ